MKFFLLLIFLVQISFGQNHFNTLKKEEAKKAILDESMEPFFSILQPLEIAAMTDEEVSDMPIDKLREKTKKDFQSFVMDFNENVFGNGKIEGTFKHLHVGHASTNKVFT